MNDPMKQAWRDVEDGFSQLGRMMHDRYQSGQGASEDDESEEPSEATGALREAFERLIAAGREVGERAANVARDDEVRAQAKVAGASLNEALSATVDLIGGQITGLFKRNGGDNASTKVARSDPPADDARQ
jgi:hypothetical protein